MFKKICVTTFIGLLVLPGISMADSLGNHVIYDWASQTKKDSYGKKTESILSLRAANSILENDLTKKPVVSLMMRCSFNQPAVWVDFNSPFFQKSNLIEYKFDDGVYISEKWLTSQTGKSLGLWDRDHAITMMKRLLLTKKLIIHVVTPDNQGIMAEFDMGGLQDSIKDIQTLCGWS